MCRKCECSICHKSSWTGCGMHVPSAMAGVPESEWCTCLPKKDDKYPPKAGTGKPAL
ncbi:uncharacterized protein CYBJADRAFT_169492 [Cyberlindnera jadinii NRRL Y-1542]|uniref:Uncharacterized protein n=1 Tax=Cyberlindnera jadinii (strain ATCC 18201 / CBS 1600 / BCRC 20928 / JCM 3617 / NBRC 0987 / NRRL Y-1542) TaxID=983966 RepID=A0A1E4RVK2_CYBJN|nr:hypothetical protein CYBJADRAFT_169492 [Cyberlindnera jadinii NRRL Y-1542]ODV71270.1 hypothetical protein CYBJADRAFT_169492 [Cyberlindnera jadinii NRRL Y-1542]